MPYLDSDKVKVFPSAYRGKTTTILTAYNPESRLNLEFNLVNIINRLTGNDSFCVSYDHNAAHKILICSIKGYWFELNFDNYDFNNEDEIWAHIRLANKDVNNDLTESLSPYDVEYSFDNLDYTISSTDKFVGLYLSNSSSGIGYPLKILEKSGSIYVIPQSSYLKFSTNQIEDGQSGRPVSSQLSTDNLILNGTKIADLKYENDSLAITFITPDN